MPNPIHDEMINLWLFFFLLEISLAQIRSLASLLGSKGGPLYSSSHVPVSSPAATVLTRSLSVGHGSSLLTLAAASITLASYFPTLNVKPSSQLLM